MGVSTHIGPSRSLLDPPRIDGVSADELRAAIGHFATGVTIVTSARPHSQPFGSTANAVTSVSLDPPLVLVCLRQQSKTLAALLQHRRFAVNVLGDGQHTLARHFARTSSADLWEGIRYSRSTHGVPLLEDAVATLECDLHNVSHGGDHQIVIGRVLSVKHPADYTAPLVFYRGEFTRLDEQDSLCSASTEEPGWNTNRPTGLSHSPTAELPDVFVPTPDGDMRLLAVDQEERQATSVLALVGAPRGSRGSLVYLHRGCLLGDALGHLHCPRRLALAGAFKVIREHGTGVVVYHRDDASPFAGCCLQSEHPPTDASNNEGALQALGEVIGELHLRDVRLLCSPTDPEPLGTELLGLQVAAVERFALES